MLTAILTPVDTTRLLNGVYGFIGAILALLFAVVMVYLYHLVIAPYLQRNEARVKIRELQSKVSDLTTPKLGVKLLPLQPAGFVEGRLFCCLEVNNPTASAIADCYGMLDSFKPYDDIELPLPMRGHKYPWTTHGRTGKQLCTIAPMAIDVLDVAIFENETFYTPALSRDGFNRDRLFPMPAGTYDIQISVGSDKGVPTKISLRIVLGEKDDTPFEQRIKVTEMPNGS